MNRIFAWRKRGPPSSCVSLACAQDCYGLQPVEKRSSAKFFGINVSKHSPRRYNKATFTPLRGVLQAVAGDRWPDRGVIFMGM